MKNFKCIDCGQEYDSRLEACPSCGCPSKYQQMPREENLSQDKTLQKRGRSIKKKLVFLSLSVFLTGVIVIGMISYPELSYKFKMARLEKNANKFKATLS